MSEVPAIVADVLQSPGAPLDRATREFMEPRFRQDFSQVRVHNDAEAAASARAINARAYTIGNDVVFGAGRYAPNTWAGRELMGHELAHVVQQAHGHPRETSTATSNADRSEVEARAAGRTVSQPGSIGPIVLSGAPRQLARQDDGPPRRGRGFQISDSDMESLRTTMQSLIGGLDENTQRTVLRNKTVAVGLVTDPDGDPTLVYTASGNWTNPKLAAAANRLGLTRWDPRPRGEGRGQVGAPGDAEQLLFEGAESNGFRVHGMAVSRPVCEDCQSEIRSRNRGRVRVLEVHFPTPPRGGRGPTRGGGTRGGVRTGGGGRGTTRGGGQRGGGPSGTTHGPRRTTAPGRGGTRRISGGTPRRPIGQPRGGSGSGLGGAGAALGAAAVGMAIDIIAHRYIQGIMDEKNAEAFQGDLAAAQPRIEALIATQQDRLRELEAASSTIFINVTLRVRWQTDTTGQFAGATFFMGLDVESIQVSTTKVEYIRHVAPQQSIGEAILRDYTGSSEDLMSFSLSYPDLEMVSQTDPSEPPPPPCFIATACYGSALAPEVALLREFRDQVLLASWYGRLFVRHYYSVSPPIADFLRRHERLRSLTRDWVIAPIVHLVKAGKWLGQSDPDGLMGAGRDGAL